MISYEKVYAQYNKHINYQEVWEEKYKNAMESEFNKMFSKAKKFDYKKFPDGWLVEYNSQWKPIAEKLFQAYDNRKKLLKGLLEKLSEENIDIVFSDNKNLLYSTSPSNYSSQTAGYSYAKGDAKMEMEFLEQNGVICEIIDLTESKYGTYGMYTYGDIQVWGNILPWQYDYLKRNRPFSLLNWSVSCWKHGINPKVRMPFLPDSIYNESMKIHMGR